MEQEVKAVRIVHDIKNRMVYNLYAEFFRFMGIYIGESYLNDYAEAVYEADKQCFQLFLCVTDYEDKKLIPNSVIANSHDFFNIYAGNYKGLSFETSNEMKWKDKVGSVLNDKIKIENGVVDELLSVFIEENVLKAAYQLQYYRLKTDLHAESERIFRQAICKLEKKYSNSRQLWYAMLYCKQKANLACNFQSDTPLDYDIQQLLDSCLELIDSYPNFTNAKVLLGMICDRSTNYFNYAIDAYRDAIVAIGSECYSSHIYYWIGYQYERLNGYHEDAKYAYTKAYQLKKKYRNIYKMAMMEEAEKNYQKQQSYFKECLDYLENISMFRMDPLEIEYYYKVGVLACYNCVFHLEEYQEAVVIGERMLLFYKDTLENDNNKNFTYFYGQLSKDYLELSRNRISIKKLYECLAIAYQKIGAVDKSEVFWEKSEGA